MKLPQTITELTLVTQTIIEVYEYNHGAISNEKSMTFEVTESLTDFKVTFHYIVSEIPSSSDNPEKDDSRTIWSNDYFIISKNQPVNKLVGYVTDALSAIDEIKISNDEEF